jgi:hypothetical protein
MNGEFRYLSLAENALCLLPVEKVKLAAQLRHST